MAKNPPVNAGGIETQVRSLGQKDPGGGHGNPLQYSCLENRLASWQATGGPWQATVQRVTNSQTRQKQLSMCLHIERERHLVSLPLSYKDVNPIILGPNPFDLIKP